MAYLLPAFFFFNDTATTEIYTLSLHDALPISRSRRVKTDRRDARTLADSCRLGAFRAAHRASDAQRHVRAQLAVRDALIRDRKSTRLNSSHYLISYGVFFLKKKTI